MVPTNLPFLIDCNDGGGRLWWHVEPSGDYGRDCDTGAGYAFAWLRHRQIERFSTLQRIVAAMPRGRLSGVEIGFLWVIEYAAAFGPDATEERHAAFRRLVARLP